MAVLSVAIFFDRGKLEATPHKDRLAALDIRQYAFGISVQSDEKSDSASAALSLCGIALICSLTKNKYLVISL